MGMGPVSNVRRDYSTIPGCVNERADDKHMSNSESRCREVFGLASLNSRLDSRQTKWIVAIMARAAAFRFLLARRDRV